jgi:hypothetical protein
LLHYIANNKDTIELAIRASGKQKTASNKAAVSLGGAGETLNELFRFAANHPFVNVAW